jgi:hypothetical protein
MAGQESLAVFTLPSTASYTAFCRTQQYRGQMHSVFDQQDAKSTWNKAENTKRQGRRTLS